MTPGGKISVTLRWHLQDLSKRLCSGSLKGGLRNLSSPMMMRTKWISNLMMKNGTTSSIWKRMMTKWTNRDDDDDLLYIILAMA